MSRRSLIALGCATVAATFGGLGLARGAPRADAPVTPIHHLVVIYDENVSFDHYFGTYPVATNPPGEPPFTPPPGPPLVDGLQGLLVGNPNGVDPKRIDRSAASTCDQDHSYGDEQAMFHDGHMDKFVAVARDQPSCTAPRGKNIVMDYFDGNTVTALWNLAAHFSLSDRFYGSTFGPSTPGALNLIAGQTHSDGAAGPGIENGTIIGDPDPVFDNCGGRSAAMTGDNIGDRLNGQNVTWGWFQGGFRDCGEAHAGVADYSPHHEPFMYYRSTANPQHLPPSSVQKIGQTDQANHQYDLADFDNAVRAGNLPQVSFLKAASFEDGHAGYSNPLNEQQFLARTLDELQKSPQWASTAVVITYDDSDGWYDHSFAGVQQQSDGGSDTTLCSAPPPAVADFKDRCGPGPRLPLLVVSPYTDPNRVDHTPLEQASIIRFIEHNWLGDARLGNQSFDARAGDLQTMFDFGASAPKLYLDPSSGEPVDTPPDVVSSPNGPDPVATPTPIPTVSPTPAPTVTPPFKIKPKLSVSAKRSGRRLTLKLKVTNLKASNGRITLTVKLRRKGKTLATSPRHTVRSGRVTLVLKAKKRLKKGRYTLGIHIVQGRAAANLTRSLTLR